MGIFKGGVDFVYDRKTETLLQTEAPNVKILQWLKFKPGTHSRIVTEELILGAFMNRICLGFSAHVSKTSWNQIVADPSECDAHFWVFLVEIVMGNVCKTRQ